MKAPVSDRNGCYVFDCALTYRVPLISAAVFSVLIGSFSVFTLLSGHYVSLTRVMLRIGLCAVIAAVSLIMYCKRDRVIITPDAVKLYGKWEIPLSEIEAVTLRRGLPEYIEIKCKNGEFSLFRSQLSCPPEQAAKIIADRKEAYERHTS